MEVLRGSAPGGRGLALAWWAVLLLRGLLPAIFAVAMGALVTAVERGESLAGPLGVVGGVFVLLQVLAPVHQAVTANLGSRVAAWLYDRLTEACVKPPGMGHLEDPELTSDLSVAREFDLGMTEPPMHIYGLHRSGAGADGRGARLRRRVVEDVGLAVVPDRGLVEHRVDQEEPSSPSGRVIPGRAPGPGRPDSRPR